VESVTETLESVTRQVKIVKRARQWAETLKRSVNAFLGPIRERESLSVTRCRTPLRYSHDCPLRDGL